MSADVWVAVTVLIVNLLVAVEMIVGNRRIARLEEFEPVEVAKAPCVSIVVAARNEAKNIAQALRSLLCLDYPDYELIVVDDRSEDATGAILDTLALEHRRLQVIHLRELPADWLGKNHALHFGSLRARGELILFTDADIVMHPETLGRAVEALRRLRVDHLAMTPAMTMPTHLLGIFGSAFVLYFGAFARPWRARDPKSRHHIGIGAFNLVRASAYREIGGHEPIRLRPDDDIKLGKLIKKRGFRQDIVFAPRFLQVEWYDSLGGVVRGLEKNAFAGADYQIPLVLGGVLYYLLFSLWPYAALFTANGPALVFHGLTVAVLTALAAASARGHAFPSWYALGYPLATLFFLWILLRTMLLNLIQGGIAWRGTFYPLDKLKGNRI